MRNLQSPFDDFKAFFRSKNILARIIIINVVVFLAVNIISILLNLFQIDPYYYVNNLQVSKVLYWLAVPADLSALVIKPWTIITYMFLHEGIWHLFFNMLILYFVGRVFYQYLGRKLLLNTYIIGGVGGALLYIVAFNFFPLFSNEALTAVALGASASVYAIVVGIIAYAPEYSFNLLIIGRVKLKYVVIFYIIQDLLQIDKSNAGGHIAHLGGALTGYLFVLIITKKGKFNLFDFSQMNIFRSKTKYTKFRTIKNETKRPLKDDEYNTQKVEKQKMIDHILDKINKSGYENLTKEEKELLFKASNKK